MIDTKKELREYLKADTYARFGRDQSIGIMNKIKAGDLYMYQVVLRRLEYSISCRHNVRKYLYKIILRHYEKTTGWSIPPFTFGKGLCVVHRGTVVVNNKVRVGENAKVHVCVNIGADENGGVPIIGNNVYIGPGAKIFGNIIIASNVKIGAGAVVNKSFTDENVSVAGVPARIVRNVCK